MLIPPGFHTVTPYFFVEDAPAFIRFLIDGLGGTELLREIRDDGKVANAQVRLGESTVMIGEAGRGFPAMPASYYLYVENADEAMRRALAAGASEILAVQDMPYGDRQGGVRDPFGNLWWISQRLVDGPY